MSTSYRIDNHKLIFHPQRVAQWQTGHSEWETAKAIYPIYMEISPVGHCNHRCVFCAKDYIGYQKRELPFEILKDRLSEMAELGVKSIMFAGEGEPLLYKKLPEIIEHCENIGIDTSLTTNFAIVSEEALEIYVKYCKWIKVSLNAGTPDIYSEIHRTKKEDFNQVIKNLEKAVALRKKMGKGSTLGAQMLLLPENYNTACNLAAICKDIEIDYLVIKPYSQHLMSNTQKYKDISYAEYMSLESDLEKYNSEKFNVIFRKNTMKKMINKNEKYKRCSAVPFFWGYIMSDGNVFGCSSFLENQKFCYGNINENSFKDIWESEKRKENFEYVKNNINAENCRENCRMDEINRYLWELKHPSPHVNFI
jgi:radical SAM protein with 4Fe4S-binding SPASM domain